jgi:hypothetical protein
MKITKRGKLPKPTQYSGECSSCGCQFTVTQQEIEFEEDRGQDHPTHKCPTAGCNQTVYCKEIPPAPAPDTIKVGDLTMCGECGKNPSEYKVLRFVGPDGVAKPLCKKCLGRRMTGQIRQVAQRLGIPVGLLKEGKQ